MPIILRLLVHLFLVVFLTIVTQIGGVIWIVTTLIIIQIKSRKRWRYPVFCLLYLAVTFIIIPPLSKINGRVPLPIFNAGKLVPHNIMTVILNRHYVKQELFLELGNIALEFNARYVNSKVVYLDANFPFFDGFPLLPHLSHNDGKKIDLCFMYTKNKKGTNSKPSRSGYGYYEHPQEGEHNQPNECSLKGYWQYDFPKYLTLGTSDRFVFDKARTKELLEIILAKPKTHKVFIEPHLESRLRIVHPKCRYHGCKAVRHDDHIHYQIR